MTVKVMAGAKAPAYFFAGERTPSPLTSEG